MRTRFAPSPTGPLHLGHAYSALLAHDLARQAGGTFLLRFEDLDRSRARETWEQAMIEDLHWLGLRWPAPVLRQSERLPQYRKALESLAARGLLYPCSCRRRDIAAAASAPQEGDEPSAPRHGPDGIVYPGTCRGRPMSSRKEGDALRLDMRAAVEALAVQGPLPAFRETGPLHGGLHALEAGRLRSLVGDVVLARPGWGASYHLAVVIDDAHQRISHVVRGADLFEATQIHVLLQALLGLPHPVYHHHRLIRDEQGKRLAKRDDARAIARYRAEGASPEDIRRMVDLAPAGPGAAL